MKSKLYVETTIPSYLTAWPSRDLIIAAHQQITQEWWRSRRLQFDLYLSQFVIQEISAGDSVAAAERLEIVKGFPILDANSESENLAALLLRMVPLPLKAAVDAAHIAIAVVNGMDFLLTWNCTHIANASLRAGIDRICRSNGYLPTTICTPEELMSKGTNHG